MMVCKRYDIPLFTTNNIPYIAEKVCNYIGIDEEAEREKKKNEERKALLRMKEDCVLPDGSIVKWYTELFEKKKEAFEKEYGEKLL
jgi:hypothetical protein